MWLIAIRPLNLVQLKETCQKLNLWLCKAEYSPLILHRYQTQSEALTPVQKGLSVPIRAFAASIVGLLEGSCS
jgi:hypothetical protein